MDHHTTIHEVGEGGVHAVCTLGHGRGVLVAPDDPRALAGAISRVLAGQRPDPARAGPAHGNSPPRPWPLCTPTPTASWLTRRAASGRPGPAASKS